MTKEELKQEAEEFTDSKKSFWRQGRTCIDSVKQAYIAGAEPREKRIEELEHQLTHRNCLDCSNHSSKLRIKTLELEKENAELRKDKKELCHSISEGGKACVYLNEQLTKAKEIIKKLYAIYYDPCVTESDLKYRDELFAEIKQFLSEVEQWKK